MIKDKLTIVIPCKNEKDNIVACLDSISEQYKIDGTNVIVADSSDDIESILILDECYFKFPKLNIKVIQGGYPAKARLEGSKLADTPYILFLDADVFLRVEWDLDFLVHFMDNAFENYKHPIDLLTVPFVTDSKYNWVYRWFDTFQVWGAYVFNTPFAIGGFQLWRTSAYWKLGGYNEHHLYAEDYALSSKVDALNFHSSIEVQVYTSPRRFQKKGILYMFWMMLVCFFNRNNPKFFLKHHNYWK